MIYFLIIGTIAGIWINHKISHSNASVIRVRVPDKGKNEDTQIDPLMDYLVSLYGDVVDYELDDYDNNRMIPGYCFRVLVTTNKKKFYTYLVQQGKTYINGNKIADKNTLLPKSNHTLDEPKALPVF